MNKKCMSSNKFIFLLSNIPFTVWLLSQSVMNFTILCLWISRSVEYFVISCTVFWDWEQPWEAYDNGATKFWHVSEARMQQKRKRQKYYSRQPSPRTPSLARLSVPPPLVARLLSYSSPTRPPPVRPDAPPLHTRPTFQSLAANGNDRRGHGASLHLRLLGPPPPPPPFPGLHRPPLLLPRAAAPRPAPSPHRPPAGLPHQRHLLLVWRGRGGGRARAQGRQASARHGAPPRLPRRQGARPGHPGHGGRHQAVRRRLEGQAHHRQLPLQGRVPARRRHAAEAGQALRAPTRGRVRVHRRRMRPLYLPLCNNCTWPSKPTAFLIYNNNGRSVGVCILFRCVCGKRDEGWRGLELGTHDQEVDCLLAVVPLFLL